MSKVLAPASACCMSSATVRRNTNPWTPPVGRLRTAKPKTSKRSALCPAEAFSRRKAANRQGVKGVFCTSSLAGKNVQLRRTLPLPTVSALTGAPRQNKFEGMACAARRDGKILLVLGEAGGSSLHPKGLLYWGLFDPTAGTLLWPALGQVGTPVNPPGLWVNAREKRAIADLYLNDKGDLWAAASEDGGKEGPFRSIIYRVATVQANSDTPIQVNPNPRAAWIVDGFKVEAVAGPPVAIAGSVLSFATDDEHYGGVWRPLYRSLTDCDCKPEEAIPVEYRASGKTF